MKRRPFLTTCVLALGIISLGLIALWFARPKSLFNRTPLTTSMGRPFIPYSINDHGQIAGVVMKSEGQSDVVLSGRNRDGRDMICLGDCRSVSVLRIDNSCRIAGTIRDANNVSRAFSTTTPF